VNIEGSHHKFHHKVKKGIVVIPHPKKDVAIGTAKSILKQAGLK
jgi:Predicted periplasmic or secreted lipoprotein